MSLVRSQEISTGLVDQNSNSNTALSLLALCHRPGWIMCTVAVGCPVGVVPYEAAAVAVGCQLDLREAVVVAPGRVGTVSRRMRGRRVFSEALHARGDHVDQ